MFGKCSKNAHFDASSFMVTLEWFVLNVRLIVIIKNSFGGKSPEKDERVLFQHTSYNGLFFSPSNIPSVCFVLGELSHPYQHVFLKHSTCFYFTVFYHMIFLLFSLCFLLFDIQDSAFSIFSESHLASGTMNVMQEILTPTH